MKLYSNYTFTNNRQIWRIIPGGEGKLVIEERDLATREVFFSCIEINRQSHFSIICSLMRSFG